MSQPEIPTLRNEVSPPVKAKSSWFLRFIVFVVLLLAVAACGGVFLLAQEGQKQLRSSQKVVGELRQSLQAVEAATQGEAQQLESLRQELTSALNQNQAQQKAFQDEVARLKTLVDEQSGQIQAIANSDRDDWLLAEVEYLLRLSNQRLLMGADADSAKALLLAADNIVAELDDSRLFAVRQAIADDLAKMAEVEELDQEGVFVQLTALSNRVDTLSPRMRISELPTNAATEERSSAVANGSWIEKMQGALAGGLKEIMDIFGIKYHEYRSQPLLPPEQDFYLKQNVRLMLNQAKSALLQGQQGLYDASLKSAKEWLEKYFQAVGPGNQRALDTKTQAVVNTIEQLAKLSVSQPIPDISSSLRALKVYMKQRQDIVSPIAQAQVEQSKENSDQAETATTSTEQNSENTQAGGEE